MKKLASILLAFCIALSVCAQVNKTEVLQGLEKGQGLSDDQPVNATVKKASRLFSMKYDLTSALMVIPAGTTVSVLESDSTYYRVVYEESEGFIYKRDAEINAAPLKTQPVVKQQTTQADQQNERPANRFMYLENKYGTSLAIKINQGKIWKGMTSEMVLDSWGAPQKINRAINGEVVREEWIYKSSWLFIDNNTLVEWGPVRK